MAKFKIVLSDPETGRSQIVELEGSRAVPLVGRHLGEIIDGTAVGLGGHKLKITGGSDKDGFPMRPDIQGGVKTRVILSKGVGIHPTVEGQRRRKTLRGRVITEEILQVNMKIVEKPKQTKKPSTKKTPKKKPRRMDSSYCNRNSVINPDYPLMALGSGTLANQLDDQQHRRRGMEYEIKDIDGFDQFPGHQHLELLPQMGFWNKGGKPQHQSHQGKQRP